MNEHLLDSCLPMSSVTDINTISAFSYRGGRCSRAESILASAGIFQKTLREGSIHDSVRTDYRSHHIDLGIECACFEVVEVLPRVGGLVFARLDEPEETCCNESA